MQQLLVFVAAAAALILLGAADVSCMALPRHGIPAPGPQRHRPKFSFDKVPVFVHTAMGRPFNATELALLQRYAMITIEKMQGDDDPNADAYDTILAAASQLKALDPAKPVFFYYNLMMDWYYYRAIDKIFRSHGTDWWLHNIHGQLVNITPGITTPPQPAFDLTKPVVRDFWTCICVNATATGLVDGCFADRGCGHGFEKSLSPEFFAGLAATQTQTIAALPPGSSLISNCGAKDCECPVEGVNAVMFEFFCDYPNNTFQPGLGPNASCSNLIDQIADIVDKHQGEVVVQVHRGIGAEHTCPRCNSTYQLGCFLMAAGHNTYFGSGNWMGMWEWLPEYDRKLGQPLGPYTRESAFVLHREFEFLNVTVDLMANTAWFVWAEDNETLTTTLDEQ